ncbi:hypothetical protein [Desulfoscipio gibsoniae]|uniref:DUF2953 domain-containing protein n=1 Tax=Desulfoscipio gibsoniae DSM 7213 TaxID=767817 RepID=R4KIL4_9FIRM|nr:hypothetical protein [Desulfoscipio gibsoniae]AGL02464.1 hypothetical protein Desgi_3099 [Desulfoscipio gibsoniae DSM 7213]
MSGWTVLIIILVLLPGVLLSVPLTFKAGGYLGAEDRRLGLRMAWGWRLVDADMEIKGRKPTFRFRIAGMAMPGPRKKAGKIKGAKDQKVKNAGKTGGEPKKHGLDFSAINAVLNRQVLAVVLGYLKNLIKSFRLQLRLKGVYGTDDPAVTGMIAGLIAVLRAERIILDLDTNFSGPILDVAGETSGRVVPIVILWYTIRLMMAKPVRRVWWAQLIKKIIRKKTKEGAQYV